MNPVRVIESINQINTISGFLPIITTVNFTNTVNFYFWYLSINNIYKNNIYKNNTSFNYFGQNLNTYGKSLVCYNNDTATWMAMYVNKSNQVDVLYGSVNEANGNIFTFKSSGFNSTTLNILDCQLNKNYLVVIANPPNSTTSSNTNPYTPTLFYNNYSSSNASWKTNTYVPASLGGSGCWLYVNTFNSITYYPTSSSKYCPFLICTNTNEVIAFLSNGGDYNNFKYNNSTATTYFYLGNLGSKNNNSSSSFVGTTFNIGLCQNRSSKMSVAGGSLFDYVNNEPSTSPTYSYATVTLKT